MDALIDALNRFDSLETVIAELEVYDGDPTDLDEIINYLNDEADYSNE